MKCFVTTISDTRFFTYDIQLFGYFSEAVAQRFSVKNMFLEISQKSQESTCASVFLLQSTSGGCF